jgi:hypothetical protein
MTAHDLLAIRWPVISLAVLAAASLAGCGATSGTAHAPVASTLIAQPVPPARANNGGCVTTVAKGTCGPYKDSEIGIGQGRFVVGQDVWHPIPGWSQKLHATSPGSWYVTANMPGGNISVISFPNVGFTYTSNTPLSDFSSITSSFTEDMNATPNTKAWAAYDIWLNNWQDEILIQNDYVNHGGCHFVATVKFGGSGGVPLQSWELCNWGKEIIWSLADGKEQSGAVDILAILKWLASKGYVPEESDLTAISYGWEICSTGGEPETFTISRFTVAATYSGSGSPSN